MGRTRVIIAIVLPGLLCLWLLYMLVDQSITVSHQRDSLRHHEQTRLLLAQISVDIAAHGEHKDLEHWLAERYKTSRIVKREDGALFIDAVGLRFRDGKLSEIVFMD